MDMKPVKSKKSHRALIKQYIKEQTFVDGPLKPGELPDLEGAEN